MNKIRTTITEIIQVTIITLILLYRITLTNLGSKRDSLVQLE